MVGLIKMVKMMAMASTKKRVMAKCAYPKRVAGVLEEEDKLKRVDCLTRIGAQSMLNASGSKSFLSFIDSSSLLSTLSH